MNFERREKDGVEKHFSADVFTDAEGKPFATIRIQEEGIVRQKTVSYGDFLVFANEVTGEDTRKVERRRLGQLPEGCYDVVCERNRQGAEQISLFVRVPGARRVAIYKRGDEEHSYVIPYPDLFAVVLVDGSGCARTQRIYALAAGADLSDDTPLFKFPLSNVNDGGIVCMGGNSVQKYGNWRESVKGALMQFFSAPYNGDYYGPVMNRSGKSLTDFLELLSKSERFPDELLMPSTVNCIGRLLGGKA